MKKIFNFSISAILIYLIFFSNSIAQQQGFVDCIPLPYPPIFNTDIFGDVTDVLKQSEPYRETRIELKQRAQSEELGDTFIDDVEDAVVKFLATDEEKQVNYINRSTACLVEADQLSSQEKKAIDKFFESLIQGNAENAGRAIEVLKDSLSTEFAISLFSGLEIIDKSLMESNNGSTATAYSFGGDLGTAAGVVQGAVFGFIAGGPVGAGIGMTIGAAVGKAAGEGFVVVTSTLSEGGEENEGNNPEEGDSGEGGS